VTQHGAAAADADADVPLQLPPGMWTGGLLQFQVCWQIFQGRVPSDLADLVARRRALSDQFVRCPPLLLVVGALKFGPIRDIFQSQVDAVSDRRGFVWTWQSLHRVLLATIRAVAAHEGHNLQAWTANCHARGTGYLAFFKWVGLIKQAGSGTSKSDVLVTLGALQVKYALVVKPTADLRSKLEGVMGSQEVLRAVQLRPSGSQTVCGGVIRGEGERRGSEAAAGSEGLRWDPRDCGGIRGRTPAPLGSSAPP
jgi:hypothetical protein